MIDMIVNILRTDGNWMSIREIQAAILKKYGITFEYNSIHKSLNYAKIAVERVLRESNPHSDLSCCLRRVSWY